MVYNIPDYRIKELEKKLVAISKKCAKYGNPVSYTFLDPFYEKVTLNNRNSIVVKMIPVEVTGNAKIENWEFIATLEHCENGNIIKRYNTSVDIPDRFRTSADTCDHCNSTRNRKNLYLIRNMETNDFKQVGKSCLKLYTGGLSAEYIAEYCSFFQVLEENTLENFEVEQSRIPSYYSVEDILAVAIETVKKIGYRKAGSENSTKEVVTSYFKNGKAHTKKMYGIDLEEKDIYSKETSEIVNKIIAYYSGVKADTEFLHNVQVVLKEIFCSVSNIGIIAYLPYGYEKAMEKKKTESVNGNSEADFFGEINNRYKDIAIDLSLITSYDSAYGMAYVYKMQDTENHVFIWRTGNVYDNGKYTATFTVKAHKEYKGQKQTEVTRCKLIAM